MKKWICQFWDTFLASWRPLVQSNCTLRRTTERHASLSDGTFMALILSERRLVNILMHIDRKEMNKERPLLSLPAQPGTNTGRVIRVQNYWQNILNNCKVKLLNFAAYFLVISGAIWLKFQEANRRGHGWDWFKFHWVATKYVGVMTA